MADSARSGAARPGRAVILHRGDRPEAPILGRKTTRNRRRRD